MLKTFYIMFLFFIILCLLYLFNLFESYVMHYYLQNNRIKLNKIFGFTMMRFYLFLYVPNLRF